MSNFAQISPRKTSWSKYHHYWTNTMASSLLSNSDKECLRNVNARVFTNQRTDGRWTKTDPKTSPEQSGDLKANNVTSVISRVFTRRTAPPPLAAMILDRSGPFSNSRDINKTNIFTKFHDDSTEQNRTEYLLRLVHSTSSVLTIL
ncbi:hypothetical protein DPMN_001425 [Dreissena polymorpha]|uniref:Uncharacterized protein n=1 Tax=Dreissena polymorpha TaxID=45954 RepID=A0A9D4MJT3_DREPO|nr:hypothetical protein DPMN_001425 [Dreissena polymorpha]